MIFNVEKASLTLRAYCITLYKYGYGWYYYTIPSITLRAYCIMVVDWVRLRYYHTWNWLLSRRMSSSETSSVCCQKFLSSSNSSMRSSNNSSNSWALIDLNMFKISNSLTFWPQFVLNSIINVMCYNVILYTVYLLVRKVTYWSVKYIY